MRDRRGSVALPALDRRDEKRRRARRLVGGLGEVWIKVPEPLRWVIRAGADAEAVILVDAAIPGDETAVDDRLHAAPAFEKARQVVDAAAGGDAGALDVATEHRKDVDGFDGVGTADAAVLIGDEA